MNETPLRIGELSRRSCVAIDTIRYYEKLGLLPRAARSPSGYRRFDGSALTRLRFIRRAQDLGFSLSEVGELLELRVHSGSSCSRVRARAVDRLAQIERKLARLRRIRKALRELVSACDSSAPQDECPILLALGEEHEDAAH